MARRSNKSIGEILTPPLRSQVHTTAIHASSPRNNDSDNLLLVERKITLVTEGFTMDKFCELILKDRNRLSKEMH